MDASASVTKAAHMRRVTTVTHHRRVKEIAHRARLTVAVSAALGRQSYFVSTTIT